MQTCVVSIVNFGAKRNVKMTVRGCVFLVRKLVVFVLVVDLGFSAAQEYDRGEFTGIILF